MSWDAVKQKYGYKEMNIATWRDPRLSVHPARGGPKSPTISPESASKPFIPRYKVRYPLPEPTDGEDSEDEEEQSQEADPSQAGMLFILTLHQTVLTHTKSRVSSEPSRGAKSGCRVTSFSRKASGS